MATPQPLPGSPTTRSASVTGVGEEDLVELAAAGDLLDRAGPRCRSGPSARAGTTGPVWRADPGSVRATTKHQCDTWASDVHTFWPLMTHCVAVEARPWSARWPGRSRRWARCSPGTTAPSPPRMPGRKRWHCSGVPCSMSVGPSRFSPMWLTRPGASARAYSSAQMICWPTVALRPPCSTGQPRPIQPASPSRRSQRSRISKPISSSPGPPRPLRVANSPTMLAASQAWASARKTSSSTVETSIGRPISCWASRPRLRPCGWPRSCRTS